MSLQINDAELHMSVHPDREEYIRIDMSSRNIAMNNNTNEKSVIWISTVKKTEEVINIKPPEPAKIKIPNGHRKTIVLIKKSK